METDAHSGEDATERYEMGIKISRGEQRACDSAAGEITHAQDVRDPIFDGFVQR
jgi:hypothetical protein